MFDNIFFILFPYAAISICVIGTIYRYFKKGFTYTSLSSQFLESGELFYASVPWHFGVLGVLAGHLIGFVLPKQVLWFNGVPLRLYILETTGFVLGLLCLIGVISFVIRRVTTARIWAVTTPMDMVVLLLLLIQVSLGVAIAVFYRWGSSWYVISAVPYLRSLFVLQPDPAMLVPLPMMVKLHIINAFTILVVFPFSRLVHALVIPVQYLWRPYQIVIWNWNRKKLRGNVLKKVGATAVTK
jgi:nitrate reductase gamma subunit